MFKVKNITIFIIFYQFFMRIESIKISYRIRLTKNINLLIKKY